jgi:hypothetical protein
VFRGACLHMHKVGNSHQSLVSILIYYLHTHLLHRQRLRRSVWWVPVERHHGEGVVEVG